MISKYFLKGHPREGEETNFRKLIEDGQKIHTIRDNYEWWKKIVDQVNAGEAVLSLRQWEGKPYRSLPKEFMQLTKLGIEKLNPGGNDWITISTNDGLGLADFTNWFDFEKEVKAIIHFTNFRYKNNG